jgi:dUTPase
MSSFKPVTESQLKIALSQPRYTLVFKALDEELYSEFDKEHSEDNAGVDVYCREDVEIAPGKMAMLKLGLAAKLIGPEYGGVDPHWGARTYHYWLLPRSSISKKGLMMANSVGVIDRTYRGELMGAVVNVSGEPVKVARGERLFQIVAPDMGFIVRSTRAIEFNNYVAEANYQKCEEEYRKVFAEINWPENTFFESMKDRADWLNKNDPKLFQKLYDLRFHADNAAKYRPSIMPRLAGIENGKLVAFVGGELHGPFDNKCLLDKAIECVSFNGLSINSMQVNHDYLKLMIMDDTSRGAGGFGSSGV